MQRASRLFIIMAVITVLSLLETSRAGTLPVVAAPMSIPMLGEPLQNITAISAGSGSTCALTNSGGAKCWGYNGSGQLGDGTTMNRLIPVDVSGLTSNVTAITVGGNHACALTASGGIKCWGRNTDGQLGDGTTTNRLSPVDASGLTSGITAISAGWNHTCVLTNNGSVKCWGDNDYGELGDGTTIDRLIPADVNGLTSNIVAVSAGGEYTCVVTNTGGIKCWGDNWNGELGDGTRENRRNTPTDVINLINAASAIATGSSHTCALIDTSGGKCWGSNSVGQLGDGSSKIYQLSPVDVSGLTSGVSAISAGPTRSHTCAVINTGGIKCWGENWDGQLGDGTKVSRYTPVDVLNLASGIRAVVAGRYHTCALTDSGSVKCWGDNEYGQIGDGTTQQRLTAVDVVGLAPLVLTEPPNSVNFPDQPITSRGRSEVVKVSNIGTAPLTINKIEVNEDYTLAHTCPLAPGVLAINAGCEITVTFTPKAVGYRTGELTIVANAANAPYVIELRGKALPPLSFSATDLTFKQVILSVSTPKSVGITNRGETPITIDSIDAPEAYILLHSCPLNPNQLFGGQRCQAHLSFAPQVIGNFTGTLTITTNAIDSPHHVQVTGRGIQEPVSEWQGSINPLSPVAFDVSRSGTEWSNFSLNRCWSGSCDPFFGCFCNSRTKVTVDGPGNIIDNRFSFSSPAFSFAGWFSAPITATGTYTLDFDKGNWRSYLKYPPLDPNTIEPNNGGVATATDGSFSLSFPGDAVTTTTSITITLITVADNLPVDSTFAGRAFQATATDANGNTVERFKKPFKLELLYTEADWQNAGISKEQTLMVYIKTGNTWLPLLPCNGCYHDTDANKFIIVLNHLTEFALLANQQATILPTLTINDVTLLERNSGTTMTNFAVRLSAPATTAIHINYATANGSAIAGEDYDSISGILTFAPGMTEQSIPVFIRGDTIDETDETFLLNLGGAVNVNLNDDLAIGTIYDDDGGSGSVIFLPLITR